MAKSKAKSARKGKKTNSKPQNTVDVEAKLTDKKAAKKAEVVDAKTGKKSAGEDKNSKAKNGKKGARKEPNKTKEPAEDDKKQKAEALKVITVPGRKKTDAFKKFFTCKHDRNENILTIFRSPKIIAAVLGEMIGVMVITITTLTLGFNPLFSTLIYFGLTLAMFKLSGANFNPLITAGMLATRRMSAIRGTLYFIAQVFGAWLGFLIVSAFMNAGIATGNVDSATAILPTLTAASAIETANEGTSFLWPIIFLEFGGAIIIGCGFARALSYKKNAGAFAAIVGSAVLTAGIFSVLIADKCLSLANNSTAVTIHNPATAVVYGMLPSDAQGFDKLMEALMPMIATYVVAPVIGGIIGFYLSDIMKQCSGDDMSE